MLKSPMQCVECGRTGCAMCDHANVERRSASEAILDSSLGGGNVSQRVVGELTFLRCRCRCCGAAWRYDLPGSMTPEDFGPIT